MITENMKFADIIHENYLLLSVIHRFGVQLGVGDKSIASVLEEYDINVDFFLEVVNSFHDRKYKPINTKNYCSDLVVQYLTKTHSFYIEQKIPEIEAHINRMIKDCYTGRKGVELLKHFFNEYKTELFLHIKKEDEVIFPYVLKVEENYLKGTLDESLLDSMKKYSMSDFKRDHDNIEEKLYDLKNIIIKYLPTPRDSYVCSRVLNELFVLEDDINDHSRLEDLILIPKVMEMEKVLLKRHRS